MQAAGRGPWLFIESLKYVHRKCDCTPKHVQEKSKNVLPMYTELCTRVLGADQLRGRFYAQLSKQFIPSIKISCSQLYKWCTDRGSITRYLGLELLFQALKTPDCASDFCPIFTLLQYQHKSLKSVIVYFGQFTNLSTLAEQKNLLKWPKGHPPVWRYRI